MFDLVFLIIVFFLYSYCIIATELRKTRNKFYAICSQALVILFPIFVIYQFIKILIQI